MAEAFYLHTKLTFTGTPPGYDHPIVSWKWDFGDGTYGSGRIVTHTYDSPGTYTVTLTVENDCGATNSCSKVISIVECPTPVCDFEVKAI